ncbi:hypothetical protein [Trichormus variabilis]|uniref:CRISPR-associated protein n=1 Tax=Trichormus variabilis SAG 1403-4b TaxID=447716 RepID=A0A3S1AME6_ANAVA|nr:hypothetical protein [Trichormus variabilis]MBD2626966.1 hypothetical protein [Trichormus variabilis FACHB-164]RUS95471.1 hypothetical protein DSM107003_31740 [Trichormus variabilis SAG 1403-4b]
MNIWIVTTGNSDVQLKHDFLYKDKARWNNLYRTGKQALKKDHTFQPVKKEDDVTFTVPARVMGLIYGNQLNDDIYGDLCFPLLDAFYQKLQGQNQPDRIIVILTNQEAAYKNLDKKSPYWKDTCTLKPILNKYFKDRFPKIKEVEYLELNPKSKDEGLDNWDQALKLVQQELSQSNLEFKPLDKIYVSHQAGTPAISSAIQFVSLAKFGKRVKFLVSNEYEPENTRLITSSNYLRGIQLQEANVLLERFDYSGVESLLKPYWSNTPSPQEEKLRQLLKIAIQWNFANFDEFAKGLGEAAQERLKTWWWTGYEAAYLAVVSLEQGNTVEALFHSFRSVEGLICKWAEYEYKTHIQYKPDGSPEIKSSISRDLPNYLNRLYPNMQDKLRNKGKTGLFSESLYQLLQAAKPECQNYTHIMSVVWGKARENRNPLFHRLLGLQEQEVFEAWDTKNKDAWKSKVLKCLNFVANNQTFTSLQKASLMYQVHQDLKQALIDYELQSFSDLLSE